MKFLACVHATLAVAASTALLAAPTVFKCTAGDGGVTYQQLPCPDASLSHALEVPAEYPPVDTAGRALLMEREAALDRRLEAQRDRLSAEAIAKISRPEPVFVASDPAYAIAGPAWLARPFYPRRPMPMRAWERRS